MVAQDFEANLVYRESSWTAGATKRSLIFKKQNKKNNPRNQTKKSIQNKIEPAVPAFKREAC